MPRLHSLVVGVVLCLAAAAPARAQPPALPTQPPAAKAPAIETARISRATSPIRIDGVLDEPAWAQAAIIRLPYEWAPGDNTAPPVDTECLVTYDEKNFYVAFRAHDPRPQDIRAHLMDRDDTDTLIQDDHVGVMIDTFNDERRAFQFRVNPLGVQADAIFSEQDGVEDFSWDMIWDVRTRITGDGYAVEIAFPLKQLRFPGGGGEQTWGFEAFRSWPRNVRHRITSNYRDRNKGCLLCQENKIGGLAGLAPGRNIELDPTATFSRTDAREPSTDSSLTAGHLDAAGGLTARWSVTSNLTLNGTVNPDFSQVEADVAQLDVNTRFALYYPEKRPFFLEGLDYFTTPVTAVFTRTVADPYGGVKLTGKQGANAIGVFATRDRLNNLIIPSNEGSSSASLDEGTTGTVFRYRRDVGAGSTVGALYSGRESKDYHNRQVGLDTFIRLNPSDFLRVQYIRSDTQYPAGIAADYGQPGNGFGGDAAWVDYQHVGRRWVWFGNYEAYGRGFRSDSGFVPRVDYRNLYGQVQRRFWGTANSWFTTISAGIRGWRTTKTDWTLTDQTVAPFIDYEGPLQTTFSFNAARDIVVYQGVRYEYGRPNFQVGIKPNGNLNFDLVGRFGGGVDFANARKATQALQFGPSVEYRPVSPVSLRLAYNLDQLSVDGGRLYRANLTQVRVMYNINVRTFVRAILQYTDIHRDPDLYTDATDARSRRLFSQYLFSYKLNPQTVLFAGYSDNYAGGAEPAIDLRQQNRTVFVKLGYALLF